MRFAEPNRDLTVEQILSRDHQISYVTGTYIIFLVDE